VVAGMMVGAAGMLLTRLMAKAMNRPLRNVLFSNFGGAAAGGQEITGSQKPIEAADVAAMMAFADRVVIVPGYGMAVAQAQHKIWELAQRLIERGVKVKFAIHPVAGRMPGHMNVLLAEAGVPYDLIADMDDINPEFPNTDVSLVIGANDVVNPVAKSDPASPIYGMPILDVVESKNVIVIKRGKGTGFAGIENALFYADNTRMLYGDGAEMANAPVSELKALDRGHRRRKRRSWRSRDRPRKSPSRPQCQGQRQGQQEQVDPGIGQQAEGQHVVRAHLRHGLPWRHAHLRADMAGGDAPLHRSHHDRGGGHRQQGAAPARAHAAQAQHQAHLQCRQYRRPAVLAAGGQAQRAPGHYGGGHAEQQQGYPQPGAAGRGTERGLGHRPGP